MHLTAMQNGKAFFECYGRHFEASPPVKVVEVGSRDVSGSLRSVCPAQFKYTGLDFVAGEGVDVVLENPYSFPLAAESADIVVSSSCFEHSEMFWLLFLECLRVLKPHGLLYLNAPSNGIFHRYPVDCWRFYPDSGKALLAWANHSGLRPAMLESYTSACADGQWNDFVAVFVKHESFAGRYPDRIVNTKTDYSNGVVLGSDGFLQFSELPEDKRKLHAIQRIIEDQIKIV